MFFNKRFKKIESRVWELEQFEKSVSKICDDYFLANVQSDLSFSTGGSAEKFYNFVKSVGDRLNRLCAVESELETEKRRAENLSGEVEALQTKLAAKNRELERARKTEKLGGD